MEFVAELFYCARNNVMFKKRLGVKRNSLCKYIFVIVLLAHKEVLQSPNALGRYSMESGL